MKYKKQNKSYFLQIFLFINSSICGPSFSTEPSNHPSNASRGAGVELVEPTLEAIRPQSITTADHPAGIRDGDIDSFLRKYPLLQSLETDDPELLHLIRVCQNLEMILAKNRFFKWANCEVIKDYRFEPIVGSPYTAHAILVTLKNNDDDRRLKMYCYNNEDNHLVAYVTGIGEPKTFRIVKANEELICGEMHKEDESESSSYVVGVYIIYPECLLFFYGETVVAYEIKPSFGEVDSCRVPIQHFLEEYLLSK